MRALVWLAVVVGVAIPFSVPAQAADGCSYDYYGRLYCMPGARPGLPYGYGRGYYREYDYYVRRPHRRCPRGWTVQDGVCKPYRGY